MTAKPADREGSGGQVTRKQLCLWIRDPSILEKLKQALRDLPGYDLAIISDAAALAPHIYRLRPVVILCPETFSTLMMTSPRDFQILIRSAHIILAMHSSALRDAAAIVTMADSVIFTDAPLDRVNVKRIVRVSEEGYFLTPKRTGIAATRRDTPSRADALSDTERTALRKLAEGWGNHAIAELLGVSQASVEAMVRQLLVRFGVRNRAELAMLAARRTARQRKRRGP